jgi:hypothetical protein
MTNPTHADLGRRIAEEQVRAEMAMCKRIADAHAYALIKRGVKVVRTTEPLFDYANDANAALLAAEELCPDIVLWTCDVGWACWVSTKYPHDFEPPNADTPALALSKMIVAWLDEQEKQ